MHVPSYHTLTIPSLGSPLQSTPGRSTQLCGRAEVSPCKFVLGSLCTTLLLALGMDTQHFAYMCATGFYLKRRTAPWVLEGSYYINYMNKVSCIDYIILVTLMILTVWIVITGAVRKQMLLPGHCWAWF